MVSLKVHWMLRLLKVGRMVRLVLQWTVVNVVQLELMMQFEWRMVDV